MKKILLLSLFMVSMSTHARFWLGGNIDITYWDTNETRDVSGAHEGFGFNGGYRFGDYFAVEGFYKFTKWRTPHYDRQDYGDRVSMHYKDSIYGAGARGFYKWLSATAGVALHYMQVQTEYINVVRDRVARDYIAARPYYGGGFVIQHYPNIQPFGEVIWYPAKEATLTDFVIGGRYYF